jgi:hypothetical protein
VSVNKRGQLTRTRRVSWDGPDPKPGDALAAHSPLHVWRIDAVEPLRHHDADGARLVLRMTRVPVTSGKSGVTHPMRRIATSNPLGPARVRQLAGEGTTAIEQTRWRDPDDIRPNASRKPRQITGYRQFCPLRRMAALPNGRVTDLQIAAADQLRSAYDLATIGLSTSPDAIVSRAAPGPRFGPSSHAIEQAAAERDVRRAFERIPVPLRPVARAVILANRSLQGWCADESARRALAVPLDPKVELGRLLSVLDLLVAHYDLDVADSEAMGAA